MSIRLLLVAVSTVIVLSATARTRDCFRCQGKGRIYFQHGMSTFGHSNRKSQCPICHQWILAGVSHSDPCPDCQGSGQISAPDYNNNSRQRNQSSSSSSSNNAPIVNGFTPEQQQALDMLEAQLHGYNGSVDQNHCYGKVYKYNPQNHVGLSELTKCIENNKQCRIASFATKGGVIIWGDNLYYAWQVKPEIIEKLNDIHNKSEYIKDFVMSESGKYWCVSYGKDNWFAWHANAFQGVYEAFNYFIKKGIGIKSVAINDSERFIVVGDDGDVRYSPQLEQAVKSAINKFGRLHGASLNGYGGCILCCQNGVYFNGTASSIGDVLKKINYIPRVCKHSYTGHYFFGDGSGRVYNYWF